MKIKPKCRTHPKADVLILEGTTKFLDIHGYYVREHSETGVLVELDEGNLYCNFDADTEQNLDHEIYFETVNEDE